MNRLKNSRDNSEKMQFYDWLNLKTSSHLITGSTQSWIPYHQWTNTIQPCSTSNYTISFWFSFEKRGGRGRSRIRQRHENTFITQHENKSKYFQRLFSKTTNKILKEYKKCLLHKYLKDLGSFSELFLDQMIRKKKDWWCNNQTANYIVTLLYMVHTISDTKREKKNCFRFTLPSSSTPNEILNMEKKRTGKLCVEMKINTRS
jgi:hypothetical protein